MTLDTPESDALCRICFDGKDAGVLEQPCRCSGTQAYVHTACLLRWRRLQEFQGKSKAAAQCEVCGQRYSASLALPKQSFWVFVWKFICTLLETISGLIVYYVSSPLALCSPTLLGFFVFPALMFGVIRALVVLLLCFPLGILFLYTNGFKLSVLGMAGQYHLGITSFGAPVDGLQRGMLLVSVGALGTFERTVLYVIEHDDNSTLAVILNKPERKRTVTQNGNLSKSFRNGGPLDNGVFYIHNLIGVAGSERLLPATRSQGHHIYLTRNLRADERCMEAFRDIDQEQAAIIVLQGFASWGPHQLEGEVRRGAWGWIKPEDVCPEDVLEMDSRALSETWERLVNKPYLQLFTG